MKVLDLHSHPSYKTIFANLYNPWQYIPAKDFLIGKIIRRQTNLTQITNNVPCNLVCISLYAPETAFVRQFLVGLIPPMMTEIDRREEHLDYFVNQLFHIILITEAGGLENVDPWEHICIGSDFDGFIRTIDCCKHASGLSSFADQLIKQLPTLAKNSNLLLRKSPQELIENIFFNNFCCHWWSFM